MLKSTFITYIAYNVVDDNTGLSSFV